MQVVLVGYARGRIHSSSSRLTVWRDLLLAQASAFCRPLATQSFVNTFPVQAVVNIVFETSKSSIVVQDSSRCSRIHC